MNDLSKLLQAARFAAKKHHGQTRKGESAEPYIVHPLSVANLLVKIGQVQDFDVLIAAVLHDTIEDTKTTKDEITELFGATVCGYVLEVTDDKNLSKEERKLKQIEHAPHLSHGAKQVKLADKISNITDIMENPAFGWSNERKLEYVSWGEKVVAGLRGSNEHLEANFDGLVSCARSQIK